MARTGVGGRRVPRRRSHYVPPEYGDYLYDAGNSEGNSFSSGNDDMEYQTRDRLLDDALFGFFRKQAVKSLKRNFSDFCRDFSPSTQVNRSEVDGVDRAAFTRYSLKYFVSVIRKLTRSQRDVIEQFGFGWLLSFDLYDLPSEFSRWVAGNVDPLCSQITVCSKPIPITKQTFHLILGLPMGGLEVPCDRKCGEDFILSHFQLSAMPHITFFGNKLCGTSNLSAHDVFVCFMSVAIYCFLCPSSSEYPSGKYLVVLKQPEAAKDYDFSKLVYDHCLASINEFKLAGNLKGRRPRAPVCCIYVPVVHYLDCLEFGSQNVDQSIPRISVWRGNMIKFFSELDRKKRHCFGKRQLKEGVASCRTKMKSPKMQSPIFGPLSSDFRKNVKTSFVCNLEDDVIDGILNVVDNFVSNKVTTNKPSLELLVNNVLDFLSKSSSITNPARTKRSEPEATNANKNVFHPQINVLAASLCDNANSLGLGNQKPAPATNGFNEVIHLDTKDITDPATPDCVITKIFEPNSHMTAPAMKPMKKVKARRCPLVSEADQEQILSKLAHSPPCKDNQVHVYKPKSALTSDFQQGNIEEHGIAFNFSPVARIDLPVSPCVVPRTGDFKMNCPKVIQQDGSKQTPILVADVSPKAPVMVGSNEFRRRRSEVAKKVDSTYNAMLSNLHRSNGVVPSHGCEKNAQPVPEIHNVQEKTKRQMRTKHMFVNFLMTRQNPPLQQNKRFPVSDEDIFHYSAIVELGHNAAHKKTMGVLYPEVHCNYQSLGESLMPEGEVDNFIIPCFCRMLFKEKHPSASARHYFFPHVGEAILNHQVVPNEFLIKTTFEGAAKASRGRNLGCSDNRLFFPIVDSHHWFVFAVDFEYKIFAFMDSYHGMNSSFHLRISNLLIDNFIDLWERVVSREHNFGNFRAMYPNVPKQLNPHDCGIFAMKFMELWKPYLDMRKFFSAEDILNIRIQYANKLYFLSQNETDLSLVTDYYAKQTQLYSSFVISTWTT